MENVMLEEIKGMPPGIHFEKIMASGVELICIECNHDQNRTPS
jgi:hypothetical protein